ncbi:hypothetical protein MIB92_06305 [Aestuariirhabdus sp. Z084]|uniref:hypothetical protein n=1 Tax=Aestuariirhabdus haliotis TaxID=2918751 RepID=UPI00201B376D|nr:hypothetical protein [Aestuariirhabdus haliotis]MCL6415254.1 hypothetical protein [Aestuariirhabdus haliotis]MCL6419514.1 hypothetical protein [Aestuariirhabdus haliotis]
MIKLLIDTLFLTLYVAVNGALWLLFRQLPFSVALQFLVLPLVMVAAGTLVYLAYDAVICVIEKVEKASQSMALVDGNPVARVAPVISPEPSVQPAASVSKARFPLPVKAPQHYAQGTLIGH